MAADDLKPTRMDAAKAAAQAFVRAPAARRRHRRRRVQRRRPLGPGAHRATRPRCSRRSTGSRPQRGTSLGQGIRAALERDRHRRERTADRLLQQPLAGPAPTPAPAPVPPGLAHLGGHRPADRRREHRAARPGDGRPGRRRPRRPDLHGRHRQRRRDDPRRQRVQGPHPARRGDAPADRRHHRRHVLRAPRTRPDLARVYDDLDTQARRQAAARSRSPRCSRAPASLLLALGGLTSLAWLGRLP